MFCTNCGIQQDDANKFCSQCGTATGPVAAGGAPKKLYRLIGDRKLAGVCGGLAQYLGIDVTVCRLATVGITLVTGVAPGLLTYLFAWIIMPVEPAPPPVAYDASGAFPTRA